MFTEPQKLSLHLIRADALRGIADLGMFILIEVPPLQRENLIRLTAALDSVNKLSDSMLTET